MILLFLLLHWTAQTSNTTASLRGLHVVSKRVVWASGSKGTFLRTTDGGQHWESKTVPGAQDLDFRDVEAFDAETAYLLASGEGASSRVYKTSDGGAHWEMLLTNPDANGFFDALAFWDQQHAIVLGDPVNGHFVIFTTADAGKSWQRHKPPASLDGEGAFAASGTSLIVHGKNEAWFATGGPGGARVFHTRDDGATWEIAKTPMGGAKTAGIFSLGFSDAKHGVAVGGDYEKPKAAEGTAAVTRDGGKTWQSVAGLEYRSGVLALSAHIYIAVGTAGSDVSRNGGKTWVHLSDSNLNAVQGIGESVWAVGPKGVVLKLAFEH